ncbi:uncharacterized protein LOC122628392 isoform X1 [Vespula pensylvanica]|uniref:uncharacterized protein LOC122628392 isoform X1 n=1 Tax=Vespula pensylvanica TaxID=30213 RepID=UPI001CB9E9E1|nr:uncharacterized protein LOC122628392 isoform X1 [Vespula pensylvanica]
MAKLPVVLLFLIFPAFLNNGDALIPDGLSKLFGSLATIKSVRIPELLNQLCNESQGANVMLRDACYGCFYRASNQPTGYPLLLAMSACADMYLNNTDYGHCQAYLRNATNNLNNRVGPVTIYCTFLECIRQVNKDTLVTYNVTSPPFSLLSRTLSRSNRNPIDSRTLILGRKGVGKRCTYVDTYAKLPRGKANVQIRETGRRMNRSIKRNTDRILIDRTHRFSGITMILALLKGPTL